MFSDSLLKRTRKRFRAMVTATMMGYDRKLRFSGSLLRRMNLRTTQNTRVEMRPDSTGETIQEMATFSTSIHFTAFHPTETTAMPTMPPMHECVVETGRLYTVARISHMATPNTTHIMPSIRTSGLSL